MTGGKGNDTFVFDMYAPFDQAVIGKDTITDFGNGIDKIHLDKTTFNLLSSQAGTGFSELSDFAVYEYISSANVAEETILYVSSTNTLYYNGDGSEFGLGDGGGVIATFNNSPTLSANDFIIAN